MKDNCSYRFDAILAVALEQDARQELAALPTPATRCTLPSCAFCPLKCRSLTLWTAPRRMLCLKIIVTIMCRRGLCWMKKIRSVQIFFCSMDTIPPHLPTAIHFPIL